MKNIPFVTLLFFLISTSLLSQPENIALVRQKTEAQLTEIIGSVRGAAGFIAIDLTNGDTFAFNEDMLFPQGSAIKIPILMEVYKQAHEGKLKLTDLHPVTAAYQVGGSGVLQRLGDGTSQLSVRDLGILMILVSDNTATNMLIDLVGMDNINATLRGLGLKETKVQRRMIDTDASARGDENLSTPAEAAKIMTILYKGEFIDKKTSDEILGILKIPKGGAFNAEVPNGVPVAFKPGGIAGVSTEWAIVYEPNRPYVIVAMENYAVGGEASAMMKAAGKVAYGYFSRVGSASRYGTYVR